MSLSSLSLRAASERSRETQERLLDAAEALFAERGFEGTSLRAVTQAAGASVSAAHYHFGSKEALLRATLLRRVEPVNRLRLERLDALEREAGGDPLPLEAILETFLRPALEARASDMTARYRQVAARLYSDPPELVAELKRELFAGVNARYLAALARALPDAPPGALELAYQLTVGAMVHVIAGNLETAPGAGAAPGDADLLRRLVAFVASGVRAVAAVSSSDAPSGATP
jgi:AcrR family transcriptional regulator